MNNQNPKKLFDIDSSINDIFKKFEKSVTEKLLLDEEAKMLSTAIKYVESNIQKEIFNFKQIANEVFEELGFDEFEKLFPYLKTAYVHSFLNDTVSNEINYVDNLYEIKRMTIDDLEFDEDEEYIELDAEILVEECINDDITTLKEIMRTIYFKVGEDSFRDIYDNIIGSFRELEFMAEELCDDVFVSDDLNESQLPKDTEIDEMNLEELIEEFNTKKKNK